MATSVGLGLRLDGCAAVIANKAIPHGTAASSGEDRVGRAVLPNEGDGIVAALAPGQLAAGDGSDGPDLLAAGAGPGKGDGAAVREAGREALRRLDAQVRLDGPHHVVDEGDVLTALVGPSGVETVGGDEDGRVVRQRGQAVPGEGAALALGDLLGVAAKGVEGEDELVGLVVVVLVRQADYVLTLLAVDVCGVLLVADGVGLAATGRAGGFSQAKEEEDGGSKAQDACLRHHLCDDLRGSLEDASYGMMERVALSAALTSNYWRRSAL